MSYNDYPQPKPYPLEMPPEGYAKGVLHYSGDRARISANPLPIRIILGTRQTDPESVAMSKRLLLQATPKQGGMEWKLSDPQKPDATFKLPPGQIYPVGRQNFDLFPEDEPYTR